MSTERDNLAPRSSAADETEVLVAMGGNLGAVETTLALARARLTEVEGVRLLASSALYRSVAIGPGVQPDYLNAVLLLESTLPAPLLLALLHEIEAAFGRERSARWGARTLDLDLLSYGGLCSDDPALLIPHPRMMERSFVLQPLLDVAPEWCHPGDGRSAAAVLAGLPDGVRSACRKVKESGDW